MVEPHYQDAKDADAARLLSAVHLSVPGDDWRRDGHARRGATARRGDRRRAGGVLRDRADRAPGAGRAVAGKRRPPEPGPAGGAGGRRRRGDEPAAADPTPPTPLPPPATAAPGRGP